MKEQNSLARAGIALGNFILYGIIFVVCLVIGIILFIRVQSASYDHANNRQIKKICDQGITVTQEPEYRLSDTMVLKPKNDLVLETSYHTNTERNYLGFNNTRARCLIQTSQPFVLEVYKEDTLLGSFGAEFQVSNHELKDNALNVGSFINGLSTHRTARQDAIYLTFRYPITLSIFDDHYFVYGSQEELEGYDPSDYGIEEQIRLSSLNDEPLATSPDKLAYYVQNDLKYMFEDTTYYSQLTNQEIFKLSDLLAENTFEYNLARVSETESSISFDVSAYTAANRYNSRDLLPYITSYCLNNECPDNIITIPLVLEEEVIEVEPEFIDRLGLKIKDTSM